VLPFDPQTSDGGIIWDRWVTIYTNATLFDYATAGAVCFNHIVKKYVPGIANPIPDILDICRCPAAVQRGVSR
jgi:hypothetical protein